MRPAHRALQQDLASDRINGTDVLVIRQIVLMRNARCHIGTSGWSYQHWARGRFYPKGLKQGQWLTFLADYFDTIRYGLSG